MGTNKVALLEVTEVEKEEEEEEEELVCLSGLLLWFGCWKEIAACNIFMAVMKSSFV
jgi:hypothetical protein